LYFRHRVELNLLEGENNTFVGGEDYLKQRGIEVVVLKNAECEELMKKFIKEKPGDWCVPRASFDDDTITILTASSGMKISAKRRFSQTSKILYKICQGSQIF